MVNCNRYNTVYNLQIMEVDSKMVVDWYCIFIYIFGYKD